MRTKKFVLTLALVVAAVAAFTLLRRSRDTLEGPPEIASRLWIDEGEDDAVLVHLIEEIGRELTGKPVAPYDLMRAMDAKFRLLGWQGLVGMAVSGLDMACWDALGQRSPVGH